MNKEEFKIFILETGINLKSLNIYFNENIRKPESICCWEDAGKWYIRETDDRQKEHIEEGDEEEIISNFKLIFKLRLRAFKVPTSCSMSSLTELIEANNVEDEDKIKSTWNILKDGDLDVFFEFKYYLIYNKYPTTEDMVNVEGYTISDLCEYKKINVLDAYLLLARYKERGIVQTFLLDEKKYTDKRLSIDMKDLKKYNDILDELRNYIITGKFQNREYKKLIIENYDAETLYSKFPLSDIGAYNYLVYLREEPQEALADLKKGLPKR